MPGRSDVLVFLALAGSPLLLLAGFWLVGVYVLGFGWMSPEPPGGTLAAGGEKRRGVATAGCWTEKRVLLPDRDGCISSEAGAVDMRGREIPPLTVSRGETMLFEYEGASAPEKVSARVAPKGVPLDMQLAERRDRMLRGREGAHFPTPGTPVRPLPVERLDGRAKVSAELPPGSYLVMVSAKIDDASARGEAFYDFNVLVR